MIIDEIPSLSKIGHHFRKQSVSKIELKKLLLQNENSLQQDSDFSLAEEFGYANHSH